MKKPAFAMLLIALLLFNFCKFSAQNSRDSLSEHMDSYINEYLDWYNIPGLSIAIIRDSKVVFSRGYGVSDVDTGEKVSPLTLYSTASVTKLFVGTAVMQLVEQNLINLNDPVIKYLPYFKLNDERYKNITVLQMLSHTSGMPDIEAEELYSSWKQPEYDAEALERYVRSIHDKSLIANPGEIYSYSSMAYDILGNLISKVSEMPFEQYIRQNILDPLEMKKSTILFENVDKNLLASPHLMDKKFEYKVSDMIPYSRRHPACGTLFSNVIEMSNWAIANMSRGLFKGKRILQDSSYDTMWRPAVIEDNPVGISWLIEELGQYRLFSHGGGDPGYRTEFYIIPEKSVGVIVMANCWEDQINPIAMKALNILLGEEEKDWFSYFQGRIWKSVRNNSSEATVHFCRELIQENGKEEFHPAILNQLGQRLEDMDKTNYALGLYKLNTELYPEIFQLFNILARTYLKTGKDDLAIEAYKKSLELKPGNQEAAEMLDKIEKKKIGSILKGPYLGQRPPGMTAELFAPGIVPTEDNEVLYGFFNNGALFLFDRTPADLEEWTPAIYRMALKDGKWTPPNAKPYQGMPWYHYYTPAPEGEEVYFAWQGSLEDRSSSADVNIWRVRKTAEGWAEPKKLPFPVNSVDLDTCPSVTEDRTLYFFSNREGGFGGHDIYRSPLTNGKHTTVENLGAPINTEYDELDPFIAPDESYLIFCSKTRDGYGGFDLYITFQKSDGRWTEPANMGEGINSSAYDWVPYVTPDGKYFFLNSMRAGSWDIYWVDAKIIKVLKPKELK